MVKFLRHSILLILIAAKDTDVGILVMF